VRLIRRREKYKEEKPGPRTATISSGAAFSTSLLSQGKGGGQEAERDDAGEKRKRSQEKKGGINLRRIEPERTPFAYILEGLPETRVDEVSDSSAGEK